MNYRLKIQINPNGSVVYYLVDTTFKIVINGDNVYIGNIVQELIKECKQDPTKIIEIKSKVKEFLLLEDSCLVNLGEISIDSSRADTLWISPFYFDQLLNLTAFKRSKKVYNALLLEFIYNHKLY